jgi:dTMP kinase
MKGRFISFEGTEGGGKTTQIQRLAERLLSKGYSVKQLREPGGTSIGEEIRHTLKHSAVNHAMTPETELLLMNASRAQLVREIIRPALQSGDVVLCDRFYDSTIAYQGYGRQLPLKIVHNVIDLAVGETRPDLTLLLQVPIEISEARRRARQIALPERDRFEEADRDFFLRVETGFQSLATAEPSRIRVIDAARDIESVAEAIWANVSRLFS